MNSVLVVDDEPLRESLARALGLERFRVTTAESGEDALSALAERAFDRTVVYVAMPGIDGLAVCRRLREAGDQTPVLMLTALDA